MIGVPSGAVLLIAAATGLAAWRAGRVPPVPVARAALPSAAPMTGSAAGPSGLRVPPALVLGWRAAFPRRGRARSSPVARLAAPAAADHGRARSPGPRWTCSAAAPRDMGAARGADRTGRAALQVVRRGAGRDADGAPRQSPRSIPGAEVAALVPGQTGTITLRGLGTARARTPSRWSRDARPTGPTRRSPDRGCSTSWTCGSATGYG